MLINNSNAIEVLETLFNQAEACYNAQALRAANKLESTSLTLLRKEKQHARTLINQLDCNTDNQALGDHTSEPLLRLASRYPTLTDMTSLLNVEHALTNALQESLAELSPSKLTLCVRQIASRHQQCLEQLNARLK